MSQPIIVNGHYSGHSFIPSERLPDIEGTAQLVIMQVEVAQVSIFEVFGKAPRLRTSAEIAAQIQAERSQWGEP